MTGNGIACGNPSGQGGNTTRSQLDSRWCLVVDFSGN
jgi:hypothetical protein